VRAGRDKDGISYLIAAKKNGIVTPLSADYEREILRQTGTDNLEAALQAAKSLVAGRELAPDCLNMTTYEVHHFLRSWPNISRGSSLPSRALSPSVRGQLRTCAERASCLD